MKTLFGCLIVGALVIIKHSECQDEVFMFPSDGPKCKDSKSAVYCEKIEHYPQNTLNSMIMHDINRYVELFVTDTLFSISSRSGFDDSKPLCKSEERLIYPQSGKNLMEKNFIIVNTDSYRQGIRVEECQDVNSRCAETESLPNGIRTECRQTFIFRPLLFRNGSRLDVDHFVFPSSCKCYQINAF